MADLLNDAPKDYTGVTESSVMPATISAVVAAASSNASQEMDSLTKMDEIISKSLLLIDFGIALIAILFNIFVLYAVKKARSQIMLEGYRGFLLSLAFSDLLIATTTLFTPIAEFLPNTKVSAFIDRCGRTIVRSFTIAAYMSALLNLAGMSVDHYIGVFYSLRYHQIMTTRLVCITVALSWLLSIIFGFFDLFGTVAHFSVQSSGRQQSPIRFGPKLVEAISDGVHYDGRDTGLKVDKHFNKLLIDILFGPIGTSENASQIDWEDYNSVDDFANAAFQPSESSSTLVPFLFEPSTSSHFATPASKMTTVVGKTSREQEKSSAGMLDGVTSLEEMEDILNVYATGDLNSSDIANKLPGQSLLSSSLVNLQQDFNIDLEGNRFIDWCSYYTLNKQLMEFAVVVLTLLVFFGLLLIYGRIFREVSSKRDENGLSHKTGKLVTTTVILLGAFFVCWIPFISFEAVMVLLIRTDTIRLLRADTHQRLMIVNKILNTTLILHPLVDPLIYAVRVRVVRGRLRSIYAKLARCRHRLVTSSQFPNTSSAIMTASNAKNSEYRATQPLVSPCMVRKSVPLINRQAIYRNSEHSALLGVSYNNTGPMLNKCARRSTTEECAMAQMSNFTLVPRVNRSNSLVAVDRVLSAPQNPERLSHPFSQLQSRSQIGDENQVIMSSKSSTMPLNRINFETGWLVGNNFHGNSEKRYNERAANARQFYSSSLAGPSVIIENESDVGSYRTTVVRKRTSLAHGRLFGMASPYPHGNSNFLTVEPNCKQNNNMNRYRSSLQTTPFINTTVDVNRRSSRSSNASHTARRQSAAELEKFFPRKLSLSWSSLNDLDFDIERDNVSLSNCSDDCLSQSIVNSPYARNRGRVRKSLTASFIMGKVETHTRLLFALNGCDLERPTTPTVNQGLLQESAV